MSAKPHNRLRVYWPDEVTPSQVLEPRPALRLWINHASENTQTLSGPDVLPFAKIRRSAGTVSDIAARARLIFANRCCPRCDRPQVNPVELDDALYNRSGLPIPGTASLVGFHCQDCNHGWDI